MPLTIKTDNRWRDLQYRHDVPDNVLAKEFDYQNPKEVIGDYFKYKGTWYHMDQFMRIDGNSPLKGWDGYHGDSYFSGVVMKLSGDGEQVMVGTYFS